MSKQLFAVFAAALLMTACKQESVRPTPTVQTEPAVQHLYDPPKSDVLTLLEKNGSGDMSKSSLPAFKRWFSTRTALAEQVAKMCVPIEQHATVTWGDSTEATACTAAKETSAEVASLARRRKAWTFKPIPTDTRGW